MTTYNRIHLKKYTCDDDKLVSDKWHKLLKYAEKKKWLENNFKGRIASSLHQCFWEIFIAKHLESPETDIIRPTGEGYPDFYFKKNGKNFWIEAVAVTKGQGANEVPKINATSLTDIAANKATSRMETVPTKAIELRVTSGIKDKLDKFKTYREKGIIEKDDFYIIALNNYELLDYKSDSSSSCFPYSTSVLYNLGDPFITLDPKTDDLIHLGIQPAPKATTNNGSNFDRNYFDNKEYEGFIGVISSTYSIFDICLPSNKSKIYYNVNPLNEGFIPFNNETFDYIFTRQSISTTHYRIIDINKKYRNGS